jgi:hypothetical protein
MGDCPAGVVTRTSTVPEPAGLLTWIFVGVCDTIVAAAEPNFTPETFLKPLPLIVTVVLPAAGPCVGVIDVTFGPAGEPV